VAGYYFLFGKNITAFPKGFRMVAGDPSRRNSTLQVPDPPQSLWGSKPVTKSHAATTKIGRGIVLTWLVHAQVPCRAAEYE
jgi:hypothetical protein